MRYLIAFLTLINITCLAQEEVKGYGAYQKQDKSFITSDLRGKHAVSIGFYNSLNTPSEKNYVPIYDTLSLNQNTSYNQDVIPLFGVHVGYNYLILSKKDKYKKKKNKTKSRTIINSYLGLHFDFSTRKEYLINLKLYHPLIRAKGFLFTWLLFNEIGIGVHHLPDYLNPSNSVNPNLSLEVLRLKFIKIPLFITATTNYDLKNDFTVPERKNVEMMFGLKYYIYKNKVN